MKFVFLLLLASFSSHAYRFVCNGVVASGEERGDECGICDIKSAARWENPEVPVVVSDTPLPKGISLSDWRMIIDKSFKAWEVPGSNFRFKKVEGENTRQFGANEDLHEIFWITNKQEWRKLVGSGEFGTLGATLPTYVCGDEQSGRVILDADLVLNGIGHVNWKVDCDDDDCMAVQTTLVHELGHFFGLDHEEVYSSTSIMSARAGFNFIYPLYDDMAGIRALYPDGTRGGFGFPCKKDKDCSSGNICLKDGQENYCANLCDDDKNCSHGTLCKENDGRGVCSFINAFSDMGKKYGEDCSHSSCSEPMVCAGTSEGNFFCYMPCETDEDCEGKKCVDTVDGPSLCVEVKQLGEKCDYKDLCEDGLFCVFEQEDEGVCRAPCAKGCPRGEGCEMLEEGDKVCIPMKESLMLDDSANSFNNMPSPTYELDRPAVLAQSGCNVSSSSNYALVWLLILALALRAKKGLRA